MVLLLCAVRVRSQSVCDTVSVTHTALSGRWLPSFEVKYCLHFQSVTWWHRAPTCIHSLPPRTVQPLREQEGLEFRHQSFQSRNPLLLIYCAEFYVYFAVLHSYEIHQFPKFIFRIEFFISLFHRAYFTYSLLIYPTNALHLKHSLVYA
jgi:hypothetical protein